MNVKYVDENEKLLLLRMIFRVGLARAANVAEALTFFFLVFSSLSTSNSDGRGQSNPGC